MSELFVSIMSLRDAISKDADNYDSRKVEWTCVNGVAVSTCWTSDQGYETAILDNKGVYPVQRYENREHAEFGHKDWVKRMQDNGTTHIEKLGYDNLVEPEIIEIVRG